MFCNQCGSKNEPGVRFCTGCGNAFSTSAPTMNELAPPTPHVPGRRSYDFGGVAKVDVSNEQDAIVEINGKPLKFNMILTVVAGAMLAALILPFFSVDMAFVSVSGSGFNAVFDGDSTAGVVAHLLWLVPAAVLASLYVPQVRDALKGKVFIACTAAFGGGLVALILTRNNIVNPPALRGISDTLGLAGSLSNIVSMSIGFWLLLLLYVAGAAVSVMCLMAAKKN